MKHVNHLAGLGLPSAEFRDWWVYQPRTDIGVNVWDNDFERPNVFTIEQVQQLYYYFKSMVVTPPATRITSQWVENNRIHDNTYWPLTNDPGYDPNDTPFNGTTTTIGEWYDECGGVPGSIRYFQAPQPPGSSDGDQPDGTWVQNGYWFNKVPYPITDPPNPFFYRDPIFLSKPYNPQTWNYAYSPTFTDLPAGVGSSQTPYTVEYNRKTRQRMRPVCIDNTFWNYFAGTSNGLPGNALNEELGNAGSGSWYNNSNFIRFQENQTVTNQNPATSDDIKSVYEINTTIMGSIYFYCLGIDPSDNQIKWTISSQHPEYNVDTAVRGNNRPDLSDFNTGRFDMGFWERNPFWSDPEYYFARRSVKMYFRDQNYDPNVENEFSYNTRNVLWIPDASCDIDAMLEEDGTLNNRIKKIEVEVANGLTITFLQEIIFFDIGYLFSTGSDAQLNNPVAGDQRDYYTYGFTGLVQQWAGFDYSLNLTSWNWFEQNNDWTITNPTLGVRT